MQSCENCSIKDDTSECYVCFKSICCKCLYEPNVCRECAEYCFGCEKQLEGDGNSEKYCGRCDKRYCIDCIVVTGCQTVDGICKKCFDYKCVDCDKDLERPFSVLYLWDHDPQPLCRQCLN